MIPGENLFYLRMSVLGECLTTPVFLAIILAGENQYHYLV